MQIKVAFPHGTTADEKKLVRGKLMNLGWTEFQTFWRFNSSTDISALVYEWRNATDPIFPDDIEYTPY